MCYKASYSYHTRITIKQFHYVLHRVFNYYEAMFCCTLRCGEGGGGIPCERGGDAHLKLVFFFLLLIFHGPLIADVQICQIFKL